MRTLATVIAAALPAAALAHDLGGPHAHPHIDPLTLVAGAAFAGLAVVLWRLRSNRD